LITAYAFRAPILTALARAWVVDEPLQKADAILVPGGGIGWRPVEAAKLYHEGYAPKILILDVKPDTAVDVGVRAPDRDLMREVLIKKGVPDTNIIGIGKAVSSTYQDICVARDWAQSTAAKRILITTDIFHTHRLKWVARKVLDRNGIQSEVHAIIPPEYSLTNWWQTEEGLMSCNEEVIKYLMYRLKY
jgi:uncharacterized SAM-binding protein YcdF (DUF218 family)